MTASELMLSALSKGLEDDGTTAAALDAIREESGCSLLAAVLEVARVHRANRDSLDVTEATKHLDVRSAIRRELTEAILGNALNVPDGAFTTITIVPGEKPPVATDNSIDNGMYTTVLASVSVGALWVKRIANSLMIERRRRARQARSRRSS